MEGEEDPDLLLAIALSESLLSQSRDSDGSNVEEASREESNSTFSSSDSIQGNMDWLIDFLVQENSVESVWSSSKNAKQFAKSAQTLRQILRLHQKLNNATESHLLSLLQLLVATFLNENAETSSTNIDQMIDLFDDCAEFAVHCLETVEGDLDGEKGLPAQFSDSLLVIQLCCSHRQLSKKTSLTALREDLASRHKPSYAHITTADVERLSDQHCARVTSTESVENEREELEKVSSSNAPTPTSPSDGSQLLVVHDVVQSLLNGGSSGEATEVETPPPPPISETENKSALEDTYLTLRDRMIIRNVPVRLLDICIANLPSTVSYAPWKWIDQVVDTVSELAYLEAQRSDISRKCIRIVDLVCSNPIAAFHSTLKVCFKLLEYIREDGIERVREAAALTFLQSPIQLKASNVSSSSLPISDHPHNRLPVRTLTWAFAVLNGLLRRTEHNADVSIPTDPLSCSNAPAFSRAQVQTVALNRFRDGLLHSLASRLYLAFSMAVAAQAESTSKSITSTPKGPPAPPALPSSDGLKPISRSVKKPIAGMISLKSLSTSTPSSSSSSDGTQQSHLARLKAYISFFVDIVFQDSSSSSVSDPSSPLLSMMSDDEIALLLRICASQSRDFRTTNKHSASSSSSAADESRKQVVSGPLLPHCDAIDKLVSVIALRPPPKMRQCVISHVAAVCQGGKSKSWPLMIPLEVLRVAVRCILLEVNASAPETMCVSVWNSFMESLRDGIASDDSSPGERLNVENGQFMVFLFHLLSVEGQRDVFGRLLKLLLETAKHASSSVTTLGGLLVLTRVVQMCKYMCCNLGKSGGMQRMAALVGSNILDRDEGSIPSFSLSGALEFHQISSSRSDSSATFQMPDWYSLCDGTAKGEIAMLAAEILCVPKADGSAADMQKYQEQYMGIQKLLSIQPISVSTTPSAQNCDLIVNEYFFWTTLDFLHFLPFPPSLREQLVSASPFFGSTETANHFDNTDIDKLWFLATQWVFGQRFPQQHDAKSGEEEHEKHRQRECLASEEDIKKFLKECGNALRRLVATPLSERSFRFLSLFDCLMKMFQKESTSSDTEPMDISSLFASEGSVTTIPDSDSPFNSVLTQLVTTEAEDMLHLAVEVLSFARKCYTSRMIALLRQAGSTALDGAGSSGDMDEPDRAVPDGVVEDIRQLLEAGISADVVRKDLRRMGKVGEALESAIKKISKWVSDEIPECQSEDVDGAIVETIFVHPPCNREDGEGSGTKLSGTFAASFQFALVSALTFAASFHEAAMLSDGLKSADAASSSDVLTVECKSNSEADQRLRTVTTQIRNLFIDIYQDCFTKFAQPHCRKMLESTFGAKCQMNQETRSLHRFQAQIQRLCLQAVESGSADFGNSFAALCQKFGEASPPALSAYFHGHTNGAQLVDLPKGNMHELISLLIPTVDNAAPLPSKYAVPMVGLLNRLCEVGSDMLQHVVRELCAFRRDSLEEWVRNSLALVQVEDQETSSRAKSQSDADGGTGDSDDADADDGVERSLSEVVLKLLQHASHSATGKAPLTSTERDTANDEMDTSDDTSPVDVLFEIILSIFSSTFFSKGNDGQFFSLLQSFISSEAHLRKLIQAFRSVLFSDEFQKMDFNSDDNFDQLRITLSFIAGILPSCKTPGGGRVDEVIDGLIKSSLSLSPADKCASEGGEGMELSVEEKHQRAIDEARILANTLCTYTESENTFVEQHWYYCYTCNLTFSEGICTPCAKICHKDHDVSYSRKSRFFCDCGAGAVRGFKCTALKPRLAELPPPPSMADSLSCVATQEHQEAKPSPSAMPLAVENLDVSPLIQLLFDSSFLHALTRLLNSLVVKVAHGGAGKDSNLSSVTELLNSPSRPHYSVVTGPLRASKQFKISSFSMKLRGDGDNSNLKALLSRGEVFPHRLAVSSQNRVAIAERDHVLIGDLSNLLADGPSTQTVATGAEPLARAAFFQLSRVVLPFSALHVVFNPLRPTHLAVAALQQCRVVKLSEKGTIMHQLEINLSLEALGDEYYIKNILWVPGSEVQLAVVTNSFVKVYDLSKDCISPTHFYSLVEEAICDFSMIARPGKDPVCVALSSSGQLFMQDHSSNNIGELIMVCALSTNVDLSSPYSMSYSSALNLLFLGVKDGAKGYLARVDFDTSSVDAVYPLPQFSAGKMKNFGVFQDVGLEPAVFFSSSRRMNTALAHVVYNDCVMMQPLRVPSNLEGVATIFPPSRRNIQTDGTKLPLLLLLEDGSLQRFECCVAPRSKTPFISSTSSSKPSGFAVMRGLFSSSETPPDELEASDDAGGDNQDDHASTSAAERAAFQEALGDDIPEELLNSSAGKNLLSFLSKPGKKVIRRFSKKRGGLSNSNNGNSNAAEPSSKSSRNAKARGPVYHPPRTEPIDFFERLQCITSSIRVGGDVSYTSDMAKQRLASNDEYLVSPSPDGFEVTLQNTRSDMVVRGVRVQVGNASTQHVPKTLRVMGTTVECKNMRRWYDIPLTKEESLNASKELSIYASSTGNSANAAIIDSLEVYGQLKEEFGWDEVKARVEAENGDEEEDVPQPSTPLEQATVALLQYLSTVYGVAHALDMQPSADEKKEQDQETSSSASDTSALVARLCEVLNDRNASVLHPTAKALLRALFSSTLAYHKAKDSAQLQCLFNSLSVWEKELKNTISPVRRLLLISQFEVNAKVAQRVLKHRPSNLTEFLDDHPSFANSIVEVMLSLIEGEGGDNGFQKPQEMIQAVTSVLLLSLRRVIASQDDGVSGEDGAAPMQIDGGNSAIDSSWELLRRLLFAAHPEVRGVAMQTLCASMRSQMPKAARAASPGGGKGPTTATGEMVQSSSAPDSASQEESSRAASAGEHTGYMCDVCQKVPIVGVRHHCLECVDFDICDQCFISGDVTADQGHTADHALEQILPSGTVVPSGSSSGIAAAEPLISSEGQRQQMEEAAVEEADEIDMDLMSEEELIARAIAESLKESQAASNESEEAPFNEQAELSVDKSDADGVTVLSSDRADQSSSNKVIRVEDCPDVLGKNSARNRALFDELLRRVLDCLDLEQASQQGGQRSLPLFQLLHSLLMSSRNADLIGRACLMVFRNITNPFVNNRSPKVECDIISIKLLMLVFKHHPLASALLLSADKELAAKIPTLALSYLQELKLVFQEKTEGEEDDVCADESAAQQLLTPGKGAYSVPLAPFFEDASVSGKEKSLSAIMNDSPALLVNAMVELVLAVTRAIDEGCEKVANGNDHMSGTDNRAILSESKAKARAEQLPLQKELWIELMCAFITMPQTSFVSAAAKQLLLRLCGSEDEYYLARDSYRLAELFAALKESLRAAPNGFVQHMPYETHVKLIQQLSQMSEVASQRPVSWQSFCSKDASVISILFLQSFYLSEQSVPYALKLLTAAYTNSIVHRTGSHTPRKRARTLSRKGKREREGMEKGAASPSNSRRRRTESTKLSAPPFPVASLLAHGDALSRFVNVFLLEYNTESVRSEVASFLLGLWSYARAGQRRTIFSLLCSKVGVLPAYGSNASQLFGVLAQMAYDCASTQRPRRSSSAATSTVAAAADSSASDDAADLRTEVGDLTSRLLNGLQHQNELLANHPNSSLYQALASVLEFEGYYLENEPCLVCNDPEVPFSRCKIEHLKSEMKFTDSTQLVKFQDSYTVAAVTVHISDIVRSKMVRTLNLYYNSKPVDDIASLRKKWNAWKKAKAVHVPRNAREVTVEFPIPITATNFMVEYAEFYEDLQAMAMEKLQCPRCNRPVTDKHGICRHCHENAYQCRQCRNINYENLHAFLCNECGYSKYGSFSFSFKAKPSFAPERMENDEDRKRGIETIDTESANAYRRYQQLMSFKKPLSLILTQIMTDDDSSTSEEDWSSSSSSDDGGELSLSELRSMAASLSSTRNHKVNRKVAMAAVLYNRECRNAFDSLARSVQILMGTRRELVRYSSAMDISSTENYSKSALTKKRNERDLLADSSIDAKCRPNNRCFGCANAFVAQTISLFEVLSSLPQFRPLLSEKGIVEEIMNNNMHMGSSSARREARTMLCLMVRDDAVATAKVNDSIGSKVHYSLEQHRSLSLPMTIRDEMCLLIQSLDIVDSCWEERLRLLMSIFFKALKCGAANPVICEHVILPCLRVLLRLCGGAGASSCALPSASTSQELEGSSVAKPALRKSASDKRVRVAKNNRPFSDTYSEDADGMDSSLAEQLLADMSDAENELNELEDAVMIEASNGGARDGNGHFFDMEYMSSGSEEEEEDDEEEDDDDDEDDDDEEEQEDDALYEEGGRLFGNYNFQVQRGASSRGRRGSASARGRGSLFGSSTSSPTPQSIPLLGRMGGGLVRVQNMVMPSDLFASAPVRGRSGGGRGGGGRLYSGSGGRGGGVWGRQLAHEGVGSGSSDRRSDKKPDEQEAGKGKQSNRISPCRQKDDLICDGAVTARFESWMKKEMSYSGWERFNSWRGIVSHDPSKAESLVSNNTTTTEDGLKEANSVVRHSFLLHKYGQRWLRNSSVGKKKYGDIPAHRSLLQAEAFQKDGWIRALLLSPCSQAVRTETSALISALSKGSQRRLKFLELTASMLEEACERGDAAQEFFALFKELSSPLEMRVFLTVRGFLPRVMKMIDAEISRITALEDTYACNVSQGFALKTLITTISDFLSLEGIRRRFKREGWTQAVLDGFLSLRGLIVQKTKLTDESADLLLNLMRRLFGDSEEDNKMLIAAYVKALGKHNQGRAPVFIFEQLNNIICPLKAVPEYQLILNKSPTQEEFIRGGMTKNPYSSKDVGPLLRDVKNKICSDLELTELMKDDTGMELLIAGKIVKLDLPVVDVYEQVWLKSLADGGEGGNSSSSSTSRRRPPRRASGGSSVSGRKPPMVVIYRLSGLDGEATEDIVESLKTDDDDEVDDEEEYAVAGVMGACGGMEQLIHFLSTVRNLRSQRELSHMVLRLLYHCLKLESNRKCVLNLKGMRVFLDKLKLAFADDHETSVETAEQLLLIIESVVTEANRQHQGIDLSDSVEMELDTESSLHDPDAPTGSASVTEGLDAQAMEASMQMRMLLDRLSSPLVRCNPKIVKAVTRILPSFTYGLRPVMEMLVDKFAKYTDFEGYDDKPFEDSDIAHHHHCLQEVCNSIPCDDNGHRLREVFEEKGLTTSLVSYLNAHVPAADVAKDDEEWQAAMQRKCMATVIRTLRGLCREHSPTQKRLSDPSMLSRLRVMTEITSKNKIGNLVENLLEVLTTDDSIASALKDLEMRRTEEKKAQIEAHRQKVLASMGLQVKEGGKLAVATNPTTGAAAAVGGTSSELQFNFMDMDLEEEEGLTCKICKEGYSYLPEQQMGFYIFSKRVSLSVEPQIPADLVGSSSATGGSSSLTASSSSVVDSDLSTAEEAGQKSKIKSGTEYGYSSVTNFNTVHLSCHRDAARADAALKPRKEEWEGAMLRNTSTRCNNIFPMQGPSISDHIYDQSIERFFSNLQNNCGRCDSTRFRLVSHDLKSLLLRFSREESLSADSRGGGRESNIKSLPFFLQMGLHLLDSQGGAQRRMFEKNLSYWLTLDHWPTVNGDPVIADGEAAASSLSTSRGSPSLMSPAGSASSPSLSGMEVSGSSAVTLSTTDDVHFMAVLSLFLLSYPQWKRLRASFLRRCLLTAAGSGNYSYWSSLSPKQQFQRVRPAFIFFALIDKLQEVLKKGCRADDEGSVSNRIRNAAEEEWIMGLKKNLKEQDSKIVEEMGGNLLGSLEDSYLCFESSQEFLDELGLLGDVLSYTSDHQDVISKAFRAAKEFGQKGGEQEVDTTEGIEAQDACDVYVNYVIASYLVHINSGKNPLSSKSAIGLFSDA